MENVTSKKCRRYKLLVLNKKHAKYSGIFLVHSVLSTAYKQNTLKEMKLPDTRIQVKASGAEETNFLILSRIETR
jgi:hypothetical protein